MEMELMFCLGLYFGIGLLFALFTLGGGCFEFFIALVAWPIVLFTKWGE